METLATKLSCARLTCRLLACVQDYLFVEEKLFSLGNIVYPISTKLMFEPVGKIGSFLAKDKYQVDLFPLVSFRNWPGNKFF